VLTAAKHVYSPLRRMRFMAGLVLVASIAATPALALAADSSPAVEPTLLTIPLASAQGFATTGTSNPACSPGGGTTTPPPTNNQSPTRSLSPSVTPTPTVTPTVLGITFATPPATAPTNTPPGGRLPFTGLPLVQTLWVATAMIGAGALLVGSRGRHRRRQIAGTFDE
jgi:hypothetical protein